MHLKRGNETITRSGSVKCSAHTIKIKQVDDLIQLFVFPLNFKFTKNNF